MSMDGKFDTVVIGAGPAGSSAGDALAQNGRRVAVIEKLDQPGGLARTIVRNGARYDIGPHRYFTRAGRVAKLWRDAGRDLLIEVHRQTRILYRNRLLHYPLQPLNALLGLGLGRSAAAVGSYAVARARRAVHPQEPASFEDWVVDQFGRVLYESFFKTYSEKVWGIPCRDIGATWASQRIKGLSLPRAILNAFTGHRTATVKTLVEQFLYCRQGCGTMYAALCNRMVDRGAHIYLGHDVVAVHHDGAGRVECIEAAAGGVLHQFAASSFISTMPLSDLVRRLQPAPPADVLEAADRLRYRTHISVNLLVKGNPFPDNWVYVHSPEVRLGRIANYRNFSASMCPDNEQTPLTFEYFTFDGDDIAVRTDAALVDLALSEGRQVGLLGAEAPADAFVVRSPKAYCVIQSGYESHVAKLRQYLERYTNLLTIGRAGMFKYNNQDHSIMTGLLAADNLLGKRYDLWAVNIDAEYHESGTAPDLCVEDREQMKL